MKLKYIPGFRLVRFIDIVSIMFILIRDSSIGANGRRFIIGRCDRGCPRAVSIVLILNFDAFNFVNNFAIVGLTLTGTPRRTRSWSTLHTMAFALAFVIVHLFQKDLFELQTVDWVWSVFGQAWKQNPRIMFFFFQNFSIQ